MHFLYPENEDAVPAVPAVLPGHEADPRVVAEAHVANGPTVKSIWFSSSSANNSNSAFSLPYLSPPFKLHVVKEGF